MTTPLVNEQPQTQIVNGRFGNVYAVVYSVESWSDPLGSMEVLEVYVMADDYGTGCITGKPVTGPEWDAVAEQFTDSMVSMVRTAMGLPDRSV